MKIKRLFKNRIYISYLLPYLLILIVPVAMGTWILNSSIAALRAEVSKVYDGYVDSCLQSIDAAISDIYSSSLTFFGNPHVLALSSSGADTGINDAYRYYELNRDIRRSIMTISGIKGVDIYINSGKYLIGSDGKFSGDPLTSRLDKRYDLDREGLDVLVNMRSMRSIQVIQKEGAAPDILLSLPLDSKYSEDSHAVMLVLIDGGIITDKLKAFEKEVSGLCCVLSPDGGVFQTYKERWNIPQYGDLSDDLPAKAADEGNVVYLRGKSDTSGLVIILRIDEDTYLGSIKGISNLIILYVVFVLLFGVLFSIVFSRKNYSPVKRLAAVLKESQGTLSEDGVYDYNQIEKKIEHLLFSNRQLEERVEKLDNDQKNFIFKRILHGRGDVRPETLELYSLGALKGRSIPLAFKAMDAGSFAEGQEDKDIVKLLGFVVENVLSELCPLGELITRCEDGDYLVFIFSGEDLEAEALKGCVETCSAFFRDKLDILFGAVIGDVCESAEHISVSYSEMVSILRHLDTADQGGGVYLSAELRGTGMAGAAEFIRDESAYMTCVQEGEYHNAETIMERIIGNVDAGNTSFKEHSYYMARVISDLVITCEIASFKYPGLRDMIPEISALNHESASSRDIGDILGRLFACTKDESGARGRPGDDINRIVGYIEQNFSNPSMSVYIVAEEFHINRSYLSRVFKQKTGIGLSDYIHKLRIARARQLLTGTGMSVSQIAAECGYPDRYALNSTFKKFEGLPPGKFRERNKK